MRPLHKSLLLAGLHLAIVCSLGAKLLYDRATRPRVWAQTAPYDPDMPIRGRYVSLQLMVDAPKVHIPKHESADDRWRETAWRQRVELQAEADRLTAQPVGDREYSYSQECCRVTVRRTPAGEALVLSPPVVFFIPEHVPDPSVRQPGEELWVEVTLPRKGPPRPIRLGVKKDGQITPLDLD